MVVDGCKFCSRCSKTLPTSQFYTIRRTTGDGFSGYCKSCTSESAKKWQAENPDKVRAVWKKQADELKERRRKGETTPKEKQQWAEAQQRQKQKDPEAFRRRQRESKQRQKDKDLETFRAMNAIQCGKRRCRLRGYPSDLTIQDWRDLLAVFERKCPYCGGQPEVFDLDHIIPINLGGFNVVGNVVPTCRPCNSQKSRYAPERFAAYRKIDLTPIFEKAKVRVSEYATHTTTPNDIIG